MCCNVWIIVYSYDVLFHYQLFTWKKIKQVLRRIVEESTMNRMYLHAWTSQSSVVKHLPTE